MLFGLIDAGPKWIIFNVVRLLSILAILLVFSSNAVIMAEDKSAFFASSNSTIEDCDYLDYSTVPNQQAGFFWAIANRSFILIQLLVLLASETNIPGWLVDRWFFDKVIPVLGSQYGVGVLGAMQCLIAASVLSHFVDDFPRVAAFFLFCIGGINLILGCVFRTELKVDRHIFWCHGEKKPTKVPTKLSDLVNFTTGKFPPGESRISRLFNRTDRVASMEAALEKSETMTSHGYGRAGEKQAAFRGYQTPEPAPTLSRYSSYASLAPPEDPPASQRVRVVAPMTYATSDSKI